MATSRSLLIPRIHIRRVREIIAVFYKIGFGLGIRHLQLHHHLPLSLRIASWGISKTQGTETIHELYEKEREQLPVKLRLGFEELGPTFIKFGQLLSLRADIVGKDIADELRKLQDRVPALPFSDIRIVIESELEKPLRRAYKSFKKTPVGSASLAQVYRAKRRDGRDVAVKVLRPGIEERIREDILIMQWIADLMEKRLPALRSYHPKRVIDEFADWTLRELNLMNEATHMAHVRALLGDDEHIYIPEVFWDETTPHVLTMEFSNGVRPDDHAALRKIRASRKELAQIGIHLAFRQFFEFGFFHGDPHPGNFFVMKHNVLCMHDFGIVGRLSDSTRRELIGCFLAFLGKETESALKHLLHIAKLEQDADAEQFKRDARALFEQWFYAPTSGRRLSETFYEVIISGARYGVSFPTEVILLAKAIITMESMALDLNPKFDIMAEWQPYLEKALLIELRPERLARRTRDTLLDTNDLMDEIPEAARHLIELAKKEQFRITLNSDELYSIKSEIDRQTDIRILSLVFVATALATAAILHLEGVTSFFGISLGTAGIVLSTALGALVLVRIRKGVR